MKTRFLCSALGAAFVVFLFWLFGFDFDQRGFLAGYCFLCACVVFGAVFIHPDWPRKEY